MFAAFHDPLVIALENEYLGLSTDLGHRQVTARTSADLKSWSEPFSLLPETPDSVRRHVGTDHFWAPELVKRGDMWRLYYCASRPGKTSSVIGLAESRDPKGPYAYRGDVVVSQHSDTFTQANAIDPCVCADREGKDWLIYGSFFGGIRILPLNDEGFPTEYHEGARIAGGNHQAIEGAYVWYHAPSDRFVLFTSWGDLGRDYHIRVAYSKEITGPYEDSQGYLMTDLDPIHHPGDKLCGGYNFDLAELATTLDLRGMPVHPNRPPMPPEITFTGVKATGHSSLLHDRDGSVYVVHHARPEGRMGPPFLQIRRLLFAPDGRAMAWPLTIGEPLTQADELPDKWRMVYLSRCNSDVVYGRPVTLNQAEAVREGETLRMKLFCKEWEGVVYRQGDRIACTLLSKDGEALWGVAE
ncbi:MAG: arabinan endo-1,5-alpha-L-arabinosidase [Clostridia bacterium]|nr:arabinan endo-1,5-alpha-L-arabinosidase [Clostridia bacterium]